MDVERLITVYTVNGDNKERIFNNSSVIEVNGDNQNAVIKLNYSAAYNGEVTEVVVVDLPIEVEREGNDINLNFHGYGDAEGYVEIHVKDTETQEEGIFQVNMKYSVSEDIAKTLYEQEKQKAIEDRKFAISEEVDEFGTSRYVVTGRGNYEGSVIVIPEEVMGDAIYKIADNAFKGDSNIESVVLSNVEYIGENAFYGTGVKEITSADALVEIGNFAFYGCTSLKTVELGENVKRIGNAAFFDCQSLETVTCKGSFDNIEIDINNEKFVNAEVK